MNSACRDWFENLKIERGLSMEKTFSFLKEKPVLSMNVKYKYMLH